MQDFRMSEEPRRFVDETHGGAMVLWSAVVLLAWEAMSAATSPITSVRREKSMRYSSECAGIMSLCFENQDRLTRHGYWFLR